MRRVAQVSAGTASPDLTAPDLGGDRRDDGVEVADHGVVGLGHHVGIRVGVDRDDLLRRHRPHPVLDRSGDAARDVQLRRDAGAGLADLVGVVAPSVVGDRSRAADHAVEHGGELLERGEALGRADTAPATDDDRCGRQRDAGRPLDAIDHHAAGERRVERRREPRHGNGDRRRCRLDGVGGDREHRRRSRQHGVLEQRAAPAQPRHRPTVVDPLADADAVGRRTAGRGSPRRGRAPRCRRSVPLAITSSGASDSIAAASECPHVSGP